ncbi:aspartic peptidase domain-containing protein [Suillus paluster]|uniref:aspartic peptidase domain-containing protein n=1 Tax=Suillus paluster TaxID=48578 RepID=UPI001B85C64C|nr:aspartic peptidase domain-containing protein [Suillus paluster]KAG1735331.1 aspartic peptidase domain-containing protein [Suillus paluster]
MVLSYSPSFLLTLPALAFLSLSSINAINAVTIYTADVGVGSPPTYYTLLVDTGSSNTWIGANKAYTKTSTSQSTGDGFYVAYGDLSYAFGEEYLDTVTLNSDLVIEKQSIGVASESTGMGTSLNGLLGVGPVDLTEGTVINTNQVPTVTDNLYAQKTISSEVLGVFFSPASSDDSSGELTFGGYDASKITGDINYVPITSTSPASEYWGVDQSISYGSTSILTKTAGIVDTGTTLILIATDAFDTYKSKTGASLDNTTGLLKISSDQYNQLSSLYFTIGSVTYELTPNAQIWPRSLNTAIGGTTSDIYLVVGDTGSKSGSGLDFTNGYCFLERFYSVYDKTNSRVGFAKTDYTYATSN